MRSRTRLLLAGTLTVSIVYAAGMAAGRPAPPEPLGGAQGAAKRRSDVTLRASAVLSAWDARRAEAWARADAAALAGLYTPRSRAGTRDVADLRRWRDRRLRVVGLDQQVAQLRVLVDASHRLTLEVTERTVDGVAVSGHTRTGLPTSGWVNHRIRLVRAHGRWLVDEVSAQPAR